MGDGDGKGLEFLKDPAPFAKRCAFCRQELGGDVPTRCARCAAPYHSDCWAANGQRCAVYGCEPAPKPVAAAPAPEPYRLPVENSSFFRRGGWIVIAILIPNVFRLLSSMSTHSRTSMPEEFPPARVERASQKSLFFERGCFHYDLQDWKECLSYFELAEAGDPSLRDAAQIRIFFARSRLGDFVTAARGLHDYLQTRLAPEDRSWEAQSLRFVAGSTTASEYLDGIPTVNGLTVPERACEAYFYAGTLRMIAHDEPAARAYFARCVASGVVKLKEHQSARAELNILNARR